MTYIFKKYTRVETIYKVVDENFTEPTDNADMKKTVDDIFHHTLLDMVLDELDDEKKVHTLASIENEITHDSLIADLHDWIEDFEAKVLRTVAKAEKEILDLIDTPKTQDYD